MLLRHFLQEAAASLESLYPAAEARSIVLRLCEHELGVKSYTHIVEPEYSIGDSSMERLRRSMERLRLGEPLQYVLGECEFCSRRFRVAPGVLIPRPETEQLCREALKCAGSSSRVLDLCSGSGCIAWTLALSAPGAQVTGVDLSDAALEIARGQEFSAEMTETGAVAPLFVKADILDFTSDFVSGSFDLILSNPPYIMEKERVDMRKNVLDYEPSLALFVPDDDPLVFYRAIVHWAKRFLSPSGCGIVEINETLGEETAELFRENGFPSVSVLQDFFDKNRFILFRKQAL